MSKKDKNDPQEQAVNESEKDTVIEAEVVDDATHQKTAESTTAKKSFHFNSDVLTRILVTLLFALIGWLSLWVFGVVVLVQFGFLLITGNLNINIFGRRKLPSRIPGIDRDVIVCIAKH